MKRGRLRKENTTDWRRDGKFRCSSHNPALSTLPAEAIVDTHDKTAEPTTGLS